MIIDNSELQIYLNYLKELVSINTIFTNDDGINEGLLFCNNILKKNLPNWSIKYDKKGNLIAFPKSLSSSENTIFLSAHIDTVGADKKQWMSSKNPFKAIETKTHIIGRGANDCKAGIAFMLLFSELIRLNKPHSNNIIFLFSYREEGNQEKTSTEIAHNLGKTIPLSNAKNFLFCLENTVLVKESGTEIQLYDREPCNIFMEIQGNITQLKSFFTLNNHWKPVVMEPINPEKKGEYYKEIKKDGGHIATLPNKDNLIFRVINSVKNNNLVFQSGNKNETSVITNKVKVFKKSDKIPCTYRLIINYRGYENTNKISELFGNQPLLYKKYYPFKFSSGSDRKKVIANSGLLEQMNNINLDNIKYSVTDNPGRSDVSAIWNYTNQSTRNKLIPVTIGPGTRSHYDNGINRRTHGPDEGFHIRSGYLAIQFLFELVQKSFFIK